MRYTDIQRLRKILSTSEQLNDYLKENGISEDQVINSYSIQWTVTTPLYNIGEQVYHISSEFKAAHPDIPWMRISGLRHRLVHDYEGTNWSIICQVLFEELPGFVEQVKGILANSPAAD